MTTTYAGTADHTSPAGRYLRQLGIDTQYVLLGFPIGLITIVLCMTGFALGIGTAIIWIGLPIMVATLGMSRGFATVERARVGPVLRRKVPHPVYRTARNGGWVQRTFVPLADVQYWLDLLHGMFRFIPSTLAFCFVITWWSVTLAGLLYPLYDWALPHPEGNYELVELLGFQDSAGNRIFLNLAIGVIFAATLYPVVRASAMFEALFARGLLSGVFELRQQVIQAHAERDVAQQQKAAAVSAEAVALRRLERDIHDGPQQRLVRLAMDLGRAEQQFATDPDAARATVAEALSQTRETLDELRALSRGIAPPILVDRGLQAALTALAGRCTVPVDLDAPPIERLDPAVESTAYFVVAEALTNVAKHSHATEVQVTVQRIATGLLVTVADDGVGGASLAKGHGLAGLDDRVRAAGGVLAVESAEGEGTRLTAALPI
ncbi:sensor histidine kinase [Actinoplanes aureus]|uniref:histidine kinase n=1 Tax=Actinoplanes aureus TaxID=2792083 RepID=A0A931CDF9_9ACTN|nr:sensor histidine kinase [Actinoplanes aureus]MBG0565148.1 sensor histidine kinase [Actinoplanes aureus]